MAEAHARLAEARLVARAADSDLTIGILQAELAALRVDNKLLIDRIVQAAGQPPIFNPAPPVAPPSAVQSNLPGPETRHTMDDVHKAARTAIRSGQLNLGAK